MNYLELLMSLMLAGMMPWAFFFPSCLCCPAGACSGACASTLSTDDIYITLDNYTAGACTGVNGTTHILNNTTDLAGTCLWQKTVTDALGTGQIRYQLSNGGGGIIMSVHRTNVLGSGLTDQFQTVYGSPIDCENISGEVLPKTSGGASCAGGSPTATVTK